MAPRTPKTLKALEKRKEQKASKVLKKPKNSREPKEPKEPKKPKKPKKPNEFVNFKKLPIELRLQIWSVATEPRIISAKWENITSDGGWTQIYRLAGGPVPKILQVNRESRAEAKRHYSLVACRLPFRQQSICSNSIYINFDIDTLYFLDFPSGYDFRSWLRRFAHENYGRATAPKRHIALSMNVMNRLSISDSVANMIHLMCAEQPDIDDITIVPDQSKFKESKMPQRYTITELATTKKWFGASKGARKTIELMISANFFLQPQGNIAKIETFKKFWMKNPAWKPPKIALGSLSKTRSHCSF